MADPKQRVIAGHAFTLAQPYDAGHALTEAEAKQLNQVRIENIGNNVRDKVKELIEANDIAGAEALVAEKDAAYEFTLTNVGGGTRSLDPVEREARKIARDAIRANLAAQGRKITVAPEGMSDDDWKAKLEDAITTVAAKDEVLAEAKKAVKQRAKALEAAGAELGV